MKQQQLIDQPPMDIPEDTEMTQEHQSLQQTQQIPQKQNPLEKLFRKQTIRLPELLSIPGLKECLNEMDEDFAQKLWGEEELLKEVVDCALRPHKLTEYEVQKDWPWKAVEFLTKQGQGFYKRLFEKSGVKWMEIEGEDEPKNRRENRELKPTSVLLHIFNILDEPAPINETSAGYLLQLFSQFYYPNQQQFFYFFVNNPEYFSKLIENFYNHSVEELTWRVIDTYNQDIVEKAELMGRLFRGVLGEKGRERVGEYVESLSEMIDNLIDRCAEINTKKVSCQLCERIVNVGNLLVLREVGKQWGGERGVLQSVSGILLNFIKFYVGEDEEMVKKKKMYFFDTGYEVGKISEEVNKELVETAGDIVECWLRGEEKEENKGKSVEEGIRLMYHILKHDKRALDLLITPDKKQLFPKLFISQPNNNILHNQIKNCLQIILPHKPSYPLIAPSLIPLILQSFSSSPNTLPPTYLNQLFHIVPLINSGITTLPIPEELLKEWEQFVEREYWEYKKRYDTPWAKITMSPAKKSFEMEEEILKDDELVLEVVSHGFRKGSAGGEKQEDKEKGKEQKEEGTYQHVEEVEEVTRLQIKPDFPLHFGITEQKNQQKQ